MSKILFFSIIVFFTFFSKCFSQERPQIFSNLAFYDGRGGRVELVQPVQVENLLMMQIHNNKQQEGSIPGFRINIFSASGQAARQNANDTRASFMRRFPEMEAYQEYNNPNFQIWVGDFRTKNQALKELKRVERVYPRAFIAPTFIDITK